MWNLTSSVYIQSDRTNTFRSEASYRFIYTWHLYAYVIKSRCVDRLSVTALCCVEAAGNKLSCSSCRDVVYMSRWPWLQICPLLVSVVSHSVLFPGLSLWIHFRLVFYTHLLFVDVVTVESSFISVNGWMCVNDVSPCLSLSPQAVAGLLADARSLAEVAREEASNFRSNYGHDIPLKVNAPSHIAGVRKKRQLKYLYHWKNGADKNSC